MIKIKSASLHNLKNIDIDIPENTFTVVTGVSGSGKSTAMFDILFEEGRRAYLEAIGMAPVIERERPFDTIEGLMPAIAVTQKTVAETNPRSVVGTRTGLSNLLRDVYAYWGDVACSQCGCICEAYGTEDGKSTDVIKTSSKLMCPYCKHTEKRPGPFSFSFNSVHGMCLHCTGRGFMDEIDIERIIGDGDTTLSGICRKVGVSLHKERYDKFLKSYDISGKSLFAEIPPDAQDIFLSGRPGVLKGLLSYLAGRPIYDRMHYTNVYTCPHCKGQRLRPEAIRVSLFGKNISELSDMPIKEIRIIIEDWLQQKERLMETDSIAAKGGRLSLNTAKVLVTRLKHLEQAGLSHLSLYRPMPTLSGGEAQRLFLASHLESEMGSVIYIFDEPTSGLHEAEKQALVQKLVALKENHNTVIAIEHDKNTIASAEHIIDFGPYGGERGGEIISNGALKELINNTRSVTGAYLTGKKCFPPKTSSNSKRQDKAPMLSLQGVTTHNLKNVDIDIPLGMVVGVAGVSGSGKSSLIADTLLPALREKFGQWRKDEDYDEDEKPSEEGYVYTQALYNSIKGWEYLSGYAEIYQKPIGRSRRSIPLSYAGIWDSIRSLYARQPTAIEHSFKAGHFSFNSKGACKGCRGLGSVDKYMGELGFVSFLCPDCKGDRYNDELRKVQYKGKSICDVLNGSVLEAAELFCDEPGIAFMLETLVKTGLGYIKCGQPVSTLSGGEAQRIKLAEELGRQRKGNILYILDEPTTGLSFYDTAMLLQLLDGLCQNGNSILIIEHDIEVLRFCDYIIELGPGGGNEGGTIIACGSPEALKENKDSIIGRYLGFT